MLKQSVEIVLQLLRAGDHCVGVGKEDGYWRHQVPQLCGTALPGNLQHTELKDKRIHT